MPTITTFGISDRFQSLFQSKRQVTHVLLTLPPLNQKFNPLVSFDLHASSTPPAFNLNQDQILSKKIIFENLSFSILFLTNSRTSFTFYLYFVFLHLVKNPARDRRRGFFLAACSVSCSPALQCT
jgi:hypothetical protein